MARPRPYLFCRYAFLVDEELLNQQGQLAALQDLQGHLFAHGPTAEREGRHDTVIMRPHLIDLKGEPVIAWSVGQKLDVRVAAIYDSEADKLDLVAIDDKSVRYNDFVAVPRLGVVAVDDRTGDRHIGGRSAISRFRTAFQNIDGGSVDIERTTSAQDVETALAQWELREVTFKVRPANPHSRSELSKQLSDAMRSDGIGTLMARARPGAAAEMRPNEGPIAQAHALSDEGYGQMGLKGVLGGHVATIRRPQFEEERSRNERIQGRPRDLRVQIETDGDTDEESFVAAATTLIEFYDRDA